MFLRVPTRRFALGLLSNSIPGVEFAMGTSNIYFIDISSGLFFFLANLTFFLLLSYQSCRVDELS